MGYIKAFQVTEDADPLGREISVEYKLILRNGRDGGKLDGSSKKWKKATLKRCGTSNTFSLTILPLGCNIVEGTTMEWKLRKEHRREDSKQWYRYSRWFPKTVTPPPSSCCVTVPYPYWHYHIPPLDKLKGEFQLLPDRRPDVLIVIR